MNDGPPAGRVRITSAEGWVHAAVEALEAVLPRPGDREPDPVTTRLALSGGSTPGPVYTALARRGRVDWTRVEILPADERFVSRDDPDSNYRTIREALAEGGLDRPPLAFFGQREGWSLREASRALADALPERLDLVVLGIGEDGHTASLFPRSARLLEFGLMDLAEPGPGGLPSTMAVRDAPKPPPERVTLSPGAIASARSVVVLARGAAKADAARRALKGTWDPVGTPAQWARRGSWILDSAAASAL